MNRLPRALRASLVLALVLLAVPLASQAPAPNSLTMLSREGRRTIPLVLVNKQEFVALDDLAAVFQLAVTEDAIGALTIAYRGSTIVLTNQALASVAGRLVSLPAPATRAGGRWLVPVEFINRALGLVYEQRLDLRKASRLLIVGDLRVPRVTVRYDPQPPAGRLTIDATPRANSTVTQGDGVLTIRFEADALDVDTPPLAPPAPQSLVRGVRAVEGAALAVDLSPQAAGFRATTQPLDATMRLTLDVLPVAPEAPPEAAPGVAALPADPGLPALELTPMPLQTIAIDAGHGGDDAGAQGADGVLEKDLTLAVARRVKSAIEARLGIRVLLTRDDDRPVSLEDRTAVANNNKAGLFVSLHANTSFRPDVSGATIYYAMFDDEAIAGAVAPVERVPTYSGATRALQLVAWDLAQTQHLDQSRAFAEILEERLRDRVPLAARPIDRAPLGVLESANMPAVLIEMGFLSHEQQASQLGSAAFQNAIAQSITEAVIRFRDTLLGDAR